MLPTLSPLIVVFGIMITGFIVQKARLLPEGSDNVLNQYVYYIAFPAIMMIVLAETPIEAITNWGFIGGYSLAMAVIYLITGLLSLWMQPKDKPLAAIRALNTTFGNTSFIGIPLMMMLFPGDQLALAAAALASLLSVTVFAIVLAQLALFQGQTDSALKTVFFALVQNPIILGSLAGVALSAAHIELYRPIADIIRQFGMTSSPCALFAIGMVLCKANQGSRNAAGNQSRIVELTMLNLSKLLLQPLLAYLLLSTLGISGPLLQMGVLLAALPTAASVYLLAHRFNVGATSSAQTISLGIVISFVTIPLLHHWLLSGGENLF
ncbi:AEC family transporter [Shewanella sp.]|uniref:AEC family transporter n=1 Tax=Shewanella sp. TaxID=50422 RepID=UPI003D102245